VAVGKLSLSELFSLSIWWNFSSLFSTLYHYIPPTHLATHNMVLAGVGSHQGTLPNGYSVIQGAETAFAALLSACKPVVPGEFTLRAHNVAFRARSGDHVVFPCPLKEQEAAAAIKALEGLAAAAIADLRQDFNPEKRIVEVDMAKAACFLMSAYLCTLDGMDKAHPQVKNKIKGKPQ